MQLVKCLKCGWLGTSVETIKQWFKLDEETSELLMICPECGNGVCVGRKVE